MVHSREINLAISEEINGIKADLLNKNFEVVGWAPQINIVVDKKSKSIPKAVPQTVLQAYRALTQNENKNPMKALAKYHAHFVVAIRRENVHLSRDAQTSAFYEMAAARKGVDIFPDNPAAAKLFDDFLKDEVKAIMLEKFPEQKEYLEFQDELQVEINNIELMNDNFKQFEKHMLEMELGSNPGVEQEIELLGRVIDRMRMAVSRTDVKFYEDDALCLLADIANRVKLDEKLASHVEHLRDSIISFHRHHDKLMTSVTDKKYALYLSSALQAGASVLTNKISETANISSKLIHGAGVHIKVEKSGVDAAVDTGLDVVADSSIKTSVAIISNRLDAGLAEIEDEKKDEKEKNQAEADQSVSNIHLLTPKRSLSDMYAEFMQKIELVSSDKKETAKKVALAVSGMAAVGIVGLTPLAPLIPVASGILAAKEAYGKYQGLEKLEKKAAEEKEEHEKDMQPYLKHFPNRAENDKRLRDFQVKQKEQLSQSSQALIKMKGRPAINDRKYKATKGAKATPKPASKP
jgi:hypothetical protein